MIDIFIVTGKSGAGKDSLVNAFMMQISYGLITNPYIEKLVPYTTRDPRNYNEKYYKIYNFVGDEELDKLISNEKVFSEVRDKEMSELKEKRDEMRSNWNANKQLINTIQQAKIDIENLKENSIYIMNGQYETFESLCKYVVENNMPNVKVHIILVDCPDKIRLQRMLLRENSDDKPNYRELCRRFSDDELKSEFSFAEISKRCMENDFGNICNAHYISNGSTFINAYERFTSIILNEVKKNKIPEED